MAGILSPETKAKRVLSAKVIVKRAEKKYTTFNDRKAAALALAAKYTDAEFERRETAYQKAKKAVAWLADAPCSNDEEYDRLIAEAEAAEEAESEEDDENEAEEDAA